jgi:hypothetical protein
MTALERTQNVVLPFTIDFFFWSCEVYWMQNEYELELSQIVLNLFVLKFLKKLIFLKYII